ncbi:NAD binding domain of 6-phosphogluconate dehydrogenase-domain-containing protein [Dactylonectria macrodidyma]|uniref:NAD binding domain of 6-phosphogluconate dehydrogenase-domain-containing protein n=1 Tax=Dactylonectria macrodidyma TaxID=307937 RepID=A0A9P9DT76_9HYPO|nr:NAD binding domain of 6-phosphogluconate dehydrogenase-domain-containing protein [Dactylonectria macrodidyma]
MAFDIAFIGLGAIGYPMAASVRRGMEADAHIHIFDVNGDACRKFQSEFARIGRVEIGNSPSNVAARAKVVISMVPGPKEVQHVYLHATNGIIAAPRDEERLLIECSTIDAQTARSVADDMKLAGRGLYVDAPVSGGVPAAEVGTLSFMIGHEVPTPGDRMAERLQQIITMMGDPEKLFWCGTMGTGLSAKISNNYISCSVLLLVAEAMATGIACGVDTQVLWNIIHNSTGQTFMGDNVCPAPGVVPHAPSSNGWKLGFKTQMFLKDLSLGIEAARRASIQPTMAEAAYTVYENAAKDPRCKDRDGSSVYLYITDSKEA